MWPSCQASQFLEKYGTRNAVHRPPARATLLPRCCHRPPTTRMHSRCARVTTLTFCKLAFGALITVNTRAIANPGAISEKS